MSTFGFGYSILSSQIYATQGTAAPSSFSLGTVPAGCFAIIGATEISATGAGTLELLVNSGGVDGKILTTTGTGFLTLGSPNTYVSGGSSMRVTYQGTTTSAYRFFVCVIIFKNT